MCLVPLCQTRFSLLLVKIYLLNPPSCTKLFQVVWMSWFPHSSQPLSFHHRPSSYPKYFCTHSCSRPDIISCYNVAEIHSNSAHSSVLEPRVHEAGSRRGCKDKLKPHHGLERQSESSNSASHWRKTRKAFALENISRAGSWQMTLETNTVIM